ncbi:uncharacterized protein I206_103418 [Kwoniella pini CBS 10737]|uniref:CAMK/CAMKL/PASK protein kinase n=1 Tax=Kwoniella pini CBS 10737 TaxID=1296096 RepID=A0A1B9IA48_9TREE|nr:CAMK/CAMKL/PASK protein kinase [Kwoniella pini CBS 10737]OCF52291.1 CAMK/CAMKL/PASK protein kinase [Kwoniella pini CBS 10737]
MSPIREQKRKSSPSIGQAVFYPNSLPPPLRKTSKALPAYSSRPASPTSPSLSTKFNYSAAKLSTPPSQAQKRDIQEVQKGKIQTLENFDHASEFPFPPQQLPHLSPTRKLTHLFDGLSFATPQTHTHETYNHLLYSAGSEPENDITTPNALPLSDLINEALIEDDEINYEDEMGSVTQFHSPTANLFSSSPFNTSDANLFNSQNYKTSSKPTFSLGSPPKCPLPRLPITRLPSWGERQNLNLNLNVREGNQPSFEPPSPLSDPPAFPMPATSPSPHRPLDYIFPCQPQSQLGFNDVFSPEYQLNTPAPRAVQLNNQLYTPPYINDNLPDPTNALHLHHPILYPSAPVSQCPTPSITPPPVVTELPRSEVAAHYLEGRKLCPAFSRRYIIRDELGSGGFGFVCSAIQTGYKNISGIEVAVKFIFKDRIQECDYAMLEGEPVESFVLSRVRHPSIIGFKELYEDNEFFYLVQELHGDPWEPGHTLVAPDTLQNPLPTATPSLPMIIPTILPPQTPGSALLFSPVHSVDWSKLNPMNNEESKNGSRPNMARRASYDLFECVEHQRFTEDQARIIFRQIVDAVGYLHRRGIYHRDLKDENIVIDRNLCVKIIDFGSAVIEDPNAKPILYDHFRGTMSYASAEVLNGRHYHAAPADIWSIGIILGILLSGESPFPNTTWAADGRIKIKRSIPPGAYDLLVRCLHTDPRRRATIQEVERHPWLRGMLAHRGSIC